MDAIEITGLDLLNFPITSRMIYDNTTWTDVLSAMRSAAGYWANTVTYQASIDSPSVAGFDCTLPAYGDSAVLASISPLYRAFTGQPFGWVVNGYHTNNLLCGGTLDASAITLKRQDGSVVSYSPLPIPDIGAYPCVMNGAGSACATGADLTSTATMIYDDVATYASTRFGITPLIDETFSNQKKICESMNMAEAYQNAVGFSASYLPISYPGMVLYIWEDAADPSACYQVPNRVVPPYNTPATYQQCMTACLGTTQYCNSQCTGATFF